MLFHFISIHVKIISFFILKSFVLFVSLFSKLKSSVINKQYDMTKSYDVIIIGGGATGAGVARDCARRGLRVLLIERFDISTGLAGIMDYYIVVLAMR